RTAKDSWLLNASNNAAYTLGTGLERLRILASRLEEKEVANASLGYLVSSVLTGVSGWSKSKDLDAATARACKAEWQRFLTQDTTPRAEGKTFKLSDPAVTLDKLFPGLTFYPKGKG